MNRKFTEEFLNNIKSRKIDFDFKLKFGFFTVRGEPLYSKFQLEWDSKDEKANARNVGLLRQIYNVDALGL